LSSHAVLKDNSPLFNKKEKHLIVEALFFYGKNGMRNAKTREPGQRQAPNDGWFNPGLLEYSRWPIEFLTH